MSVYDKEIEYYVFIQFKEKLTDEQREKIKVYLVEHFLEADGLSSEDLHVDFDSDESEAEEFNDNFINEFSNLIK